MQELLKLITDLVNFKTVYLNNKEFDNCFEYIKKYFKNNNLYIKEYAFNGSKSIVISNSKSKTLDVVFCGHIDVVPAQDNLFNIKKDKDILYARGVADMKGQVAVMMQLMREYTVIPGSLDTARCATRDERDLGSKKIALFLTSDEERGGFDGVNKLLNQEKYSCKIAIVPDGGFNYTIVQEAKGVLQLKITSLGKQAHSSELFNGKNAIVNLINLFKDIEKQYKNPKNYNNWKSSFNLAKIEGGDALNKVPDKACIYLDIRHVHKDNKNNIINFIKSLNKNINIEILASGNAYKIDKNDIYITKYKKISENILNKKVKFIKCNTASDGRFFTEKNIPCIIINPVGGNIHSDNEYVSLSSLVKLKKIYKKYLSDL